MSKAKSAGSGKRSEVNEMRGLLMSLEVQRDPKRYVKTCQRVIQYMTLGVDVSQLFTEMIMASATQNMVQKKLVYLYICTYAESHSDLTLLAINTLQKDCRDSNPMVRGLALRAMCGLRVPNLVEYAMVPLLACLQDKSPYVRKAAVLGCVKLFYYARDAIDEHSVPETLYAMLQDRDAQVVANCVIALEEILSAEGGLLLTKAVVVSLMNRLTDFTEWNQCIIMGVLARYTPGDEDEVFDLLNVLDDRLKHTNAGVLMGAAKLFLHFTDGMPDVQADIYDRLKAPLITQMASSVPETCYVVLTHVEVLLARCPDLFEADYKALFCRYKDPSYIKWRKLELLTVVASPVNMVPIVEELSANATDVDADMARHSIRAIGRIAVKLEPAVDHCISMMQAFLEIGADYVTAETLVIFKDVLRKYPSKTSDCIDHIFTVVSYESLVDEPDARAAYLWLLGAHGERFESAPYVLETIVEHVDEEEAASVRLELLTTAVKLFFARPPECQRTLGRLLDHAIEEELHMDVHDRALLYYRLLRAGTQEAQRVICGSSEAVEAFLDLNEAARSRTIGEFNTLCVIYGQPAEAFIEQTAPYAPSGDGERAMGGGVGGGGGGSGGGGGDGSGGGSLVGDLISTDDALPFRESDMLKLRPNVQLPPAQFETIWMGNETSAVVKDVLSIVPSTGTAHEVQKAMQVYGIQLMASSPPQAGAIKFFFYAQERDIDTYHLAEATLELESRMFSASVRSTDADTAPMFSMVLREALARAGYITMGM
eukprot:UC1_evm1s1561